MADIIITVISGETTDLSLSIPGVQGPIGSNTTPSGGVAGNILVKQSSVDYDSAWASQASGLTLINAIASGIWTNAGTISGGTYVGALFNGGTVSGATIASGVANNVAISSALIDGSTIDNSFIGDSTITTTTISGCDIVQATISGAFSTGDGVVIGGASERLSFFGSSAVVRPSGIVIPSGGSSVDEVGTVVSGIIVALQSLGLLGA